MTSYLYENYISVKLPKKANKKMQFKDCTIFHSAHDCFPFSMAMILSNFL